MYFLLYSKQSPSLLFIIKLEEIHILSFRNQYDKTWEENHFKV